MSDLEKKRFNMLADNDKRRYEYEVSLFNNSKAETGKAKGKVKKLKDPNAPKRPMSAYFIFMNATRDSVKAKNPGISTGDCSKVIGKMWAEMEPREKEKYDVLAAEAKEKYEGEKAAYDAKQTGGHGEVEEEEDMEEESD